MGIEQSGGTDPRVEGVDKPQGRDRRPALPPDRPGQPGSPSRLESLRAAREAQEARAAELESRPENNSEQVDGREDKETEASATEQRNVQRESKEAETAERDQTREAEPLLAETTAEEAAPSAEAQVAARRPDARTEGSRYPEITDRSGYAFTEREYAFADVSPEEVMDMQAQRVPLGIDADQWTACVTELHEALTAEDITDADVRLKGSGARLCSENPTKWFPQDEDELRAEVVKKNRNAPEEERTQRADEAVAVYRTAGFSQEGPKPAAPFFDCMYKLDATGEASDYDFQIASDGLARRFQELQKTSPDVEWRSRQGGHFKHRHLVQAAPALYEWAARWEDTFERGVTLATFDGQGPAAGLSDHDWILIKPGESR
ncbi:hypothetical protein ACIBI3_33525 [Actinomadura luteofluorescens]|uniref:hypothetical protein n=1 Tax=Actinomadura luteofluorescens TaxID=46163 RepID=UPI003496ABC9